MQKKNKLSVSNEQPVFWMQVCYATAAAAATATATATALLFVTNVK